MVSEVTALPLCRKAICRLRRKTFYSTIPVNIKTDSEDLQSDKKATMRVLMNLVLKRHCCCCSYWVSTTCSMIKVNGANDTKTVKFTTLVCLKDNDEGRVRQSQNKSNFEEKFWLLKPLALAKMDKCQAAQWICLCLPPFGSGFYSWWRHHLRYSAQFNWNY